MTETQLSISLWAIETFGRPQKRATIASRAADELDELLDAPADRVPQELADVHIVLYQLANRLGIDMDDEVSKHCNEITKIFGLQTKDYHEVLDLADELMSALVEELLERDDYPRATGKLIELCVVLRLIAVLHGINLHDEVNRKMAVNRARKWVTDGTGIGQHVADATHDSVPTSIEDVDTTPYRIGATQ